MAQTELLGLKAISEKTNLTPTSIMRYVSQGMPHERSFKGTRKVLKFDEEKVNQWIELQRTGK